MSDNLVPQIGADKVSPVMTANLEDKLKDGGNSPMGLHKTGANRKDRTTIHGQSTQEDDQQYPESP